MEGYHAMNSHLVFDVPYPERSSRLTVFFRGLLVIPQSIVLQFIVAALWFVTGIAGLAILILGRHPRGLWTFALMAINWAANVNAYNLYLRDEYPPFGAGPYPVRFELEYPERQSRLIALFRGLLIIPHAIVLILLLSAGLAVWVVAWVAIIITGRYPRGLFDFEVGVTRWQMRVATYAHHLTDAYPPFSLD